MQKSHAPRQNKKSTTKFPAKGKPPALAEVRAYTKRHPEDVVGWQKLGELLLEKEPDEAQQVLSYALKLDETNYTTIELLARAEHRIGNELKAVKLIEQALELNPDYAQAHFSIAKMLIDRNQNDRALQHILKADELKPNNNNILSRKSLILYLLRRYDEALAILELLIKEEPNIYTHWNNVGNIKNNLGLFEEADYYFRQAVRLAKNQYPEPFSNLVTTLHYRPDYSRDAIFEVCKEWQTRFAPKTRPSRPHAIDKSTDRRIRVAIFSDGFRTHPVGSMTASVFEHLDKESIELFAYSTNNAVDHLTTRIKRAVDHWMSIQHLSDDAFSKQLRNDKIDILIDLCGHGSGTRMRTVAMEPAPIIVKWVGSLINTTGLDAIDYLLSDNIETPAGEDEFYTEKLIRMPDDYICYVPPSYTPPTNNLPAKENGYITFGCFNNPCKVNEVVLQEWATILHALPNSRLFLKGHQYNSKGLQRRFTKIMERHGISEERMIFEGSSPHKTLLQTYNRIDIALDPWPYSGGLTTCEAMLMGVPVVTFPGPTFAGRHSATHLINAGMPELVVSSWDEYKNRAIGLANDLDSLATIRNHLRSILLNSPICDGKRFARHFTTAMRAIWQRYCEDRTPAALTIDTDGYAWFKDEEQPVNILDVGPQSNFSFTFKGKVLAVDHGALLLEDEKFTHLHSSGAFHTIAFDPTSRVDPSKLLPGQSVQHVPHMALGDGEKITMFACLDPALSATLEPIEETQQSSSYQGADIIAKLSLNSFRLDDLEGCENIDWLLLDNLHDNGKILENGKQALANTLLVTVRINFTPTHHQQSAITTIGPRLDSHGFALYRLENLRYRSQFPDQTSEFKQHASQLICADAIYIPTSARLRAMTENHKLKLAFIAHQAYQLKDLCYKLLHDINQDDAKRYLANEKLPAAPLTDAFSAPMPISPHRSLDESREMQTQGTFVHLCFNNMHVQPLVSLLQDQYATAGFRHDILIEQSRSVPGYDVDIQSNPNASFFNQHTQLNNIFNACLKADVIAIFFHGIFFEWQKKLIKAIGKSKKTIWIMWGGDLYNPINTNKPITEIAAEVHAVSAVVDKDYEIFCEHYAYKPRITLAYPPRYSFADINLPPRKAKKIFVGNSGDPSNKHLDILNALAKKKDIRDYDIIIPFSYNSTKEYEQIIIQTLKDLKIFNQTTLLKDLIDADKYFTALAEAEFLITAHNRQQAMGTLLAALCFGVKTILRKEITLDGVLMVNPSWQQLTEIFDAQPVAYEDFAQFPELSNISFVPEGAWQKQRNNILEYYDEKSVKENMKNEFLRISEGNLT